MNAREIMSHLASADPLELKDHWLDGGGVASGLADGRAQRSDAEALTTPPDSKDLPGDETMRFGIMVCSPPWKPPHEVRGVCTEERSARLYRVLRDCKVRLDNDHLWTNLPNHRHQVGTIGAANTHLHSRTNDVMDHQMLCRWTVNKATIRAEIMARNAIRKAALLPLLDEQKEFESACRQIQRHRWHAFKESKRADYERLRKDVYAQREPSAGLMSKWALHVELEKRFEMFLRARYADDIAKTLEIVPDYLAITRLVVET